MADKKKTKKSKLQQKAGLATLAKYGKEHFSRIATERHKRERRAKKLLNK